MQDAKYILTLIPTIIIKNSKNIRLFLQNYLGLHE